MKGTVENSIILILVMACKVCFATPITAFSDTQSSRDNTMADKKVAWTFISGGMLKGGMENLIFENGDNDNKLLLLNSIGHLSGDPDSRAQIGSRLSDRNNFSH